jgi:hypothetical protein
LTLKNFELQIDLRNTAKRCAESNFVINIEIIITIRIELFLSIFIFVKSNIHSAAHLMIFVHRFFSVMLIIFFNYVAFLLFYKVTGKSNLAVIVILFISLLSFNLLGVRSSTF